MTERVFQFIRRRIIEETGLTVSAAADRLGMSRPPFSNVLNDNASLSIQLALKIEREFGLDARDLLVRQLDEQIGDERLNAHEVS